MHSDIDELIAICFGAIALLVMIVLLAAAVGAACDGLLSLGLDWCMADGVDAAPGGA